MDVSVIIATHNRWQMLRDTLDAMTRLKCGSLSWELLVVDNNSSDRTQDTVESYSPRLPIRYYFEPRQGKNFAVNTGVERALGDILAFTDDDASPDTEWLVDIVAATRHRPDAVLFGGRVIPHFPPDTPHFVISSDFSSYVYAGLDLGNVPCPFPDDEYPNGTNCWIRRCLFEEGVRFDPHIGPNGKGRIAGSEVELFARLAARGHRSLYVPSAVVVHRIPIGRTTIRYLLRRAYAMGRGNVRVFGSKSPKCRNVFGVPRYYYRQLCEGIMRAAGFGAVLRFKRAFEETMRCAMIYGSICESRRRPPPSGGAI